MKIVMLASLHVPFDTRIFFKEAKSLKKYGHEVTIIVPHDHNVSIDGIEIIAVSKPSDGRIRLLKTLYQIFKNAKNQDKNAVIHFHDSELILYAILLKFMGRTVVYDAHEDTPKQIMYQHWIPKLLRKPVALFYYLFEKFGGLIFDGIIIAEPIIGRYFPSKKTILIRNYALIDEQEIKYENIPYSQRENTMAYIGGITVARGASRMIEAIGKVSNKMDFKFLLGGTFHPKNLKYQLENMSGWNRVNYLGWLSRADVAKVLGSVKIGIIIPEPNSRYKTNYPVKLFEYMEAGIPVIASREGISKKFVEESECGILVDPNDADQIAESIQYLLSHTDEAEAMGKRGKQAIIESYNWKSEEKKLIDFYSTLKST